MVFMIINIAIRPPGRRAEGVPRRESATSYVVCSHSGPRDRRLVLGRRMGGAVPRTIPLRHIAPDFDEMLCQLLPRRTLQQHLQRAVEVIATCCAAQRGYTSMHSSDFAGRA